VRKDNVKIEANIWQKVPGTNFIEFFPIIAKPSIVSSNCYILAAPEAILIIDPGASPQQTKHISETVSAPWQRPIGRSSFFSPIVIKTTRRKQAFLSCPPAQKSSGLHTKRALRRWSAVTENLQCYLYPWRPVVCGHLSTADYLPQSKKSPKSSHSSSRNAGESSYIASLSQCQWRRAETAVAASRCW